MIAFTTRTLKRVPGQTTPRYPSCILHRTNIPNIPDDPHIVSGTGTGHTRPTTGHRTKHTMNTNWQTHQATKLSRTFKNHCQQHQAPCWLCGHPIHYTAPPTHPFSFETDHYHPRKTHPHLTLTWQNLRPAHKTCNRSRGTKPPPTPPKPIPPTRPPSHTHRRKRSQSSRPPRTQPQHLLRLEIPRPRTQPKLGQRGTPMARPHRKDTNQ